MACLNDGTAGMSSRVACFHKLFVVSCSNCQPRWVADSETEPGIVEASFSPKARWICRCGNYVALSLPELGGLLAVNDREREIAAGSAELDSVDLWLFAAEMCEIVGRRRHRL